jgi:transcriptional regulator with XRE-family HTH domain
MAETEYMSNTEFQQLIVEAREDFTDLQLASYMRVSIPTIDRWARGVTACSPMLRKAVKDKIQDVRGY